MDNIYDFSDIAPFDDSVFHEKMELLVREQGFEHAVRFIFPNIDYQEYAKGLLQVPDKETFQAKVMKPFLEMLVQRTTDGITTGGFENVERGKSYAFISNHRDIVLDASFLNYCFFQHNLPTSEVAIGNNLLIYDWITDLIKLNKCFIVKRNLRLTKAFEAAKQLSAYIHYAVGEKHESVWIAQREGRAKDSNDRTQESVIKMLALEGGGSLLENLHDINIVPVSISYEYDPNDCLKARELHIRSLDPNFKKSQRDDLCSMETGLLQHKGRIHFEVGECINPQLEELKSLNDKVEIVKQVCATMDRAIHSRYHIYPINYVAYDMLEGKNEFSDKYTDEDVAKVNSYIDGQLDKVMNEPSDYNLDRKAMREIMLAMYANPLRNKIKATEA